MTTPGFPCVPVCKACREAGTCPSMQRKTAENTGRVRDFHGGVCKAPCGCYVLPWPLIHKMGDNFDEIFCDKHGWMKVRKSDKEKMSKEAKTMKKAEIPIEPLW